jgi:hypothetical protein
VRPKQRQVDAMRRLDAPHGEARADGRSGS